MGSGRWDHVAYRSATASRATAGVDDFHYSHTSTAHTPVHPNLDPMRIKDKPFHKLESRDSTEHPQSNAVFVSFDVTGSNIERARVAQQKLPNLMKLLERYLSDPQVAFAANDDITVEDRRSIQISDFESDNRIDEHLRNILLTAKGGGNDGESYDLILFAAAGMTVLDCLEKRGRKGYFFMYADEPIFQGVDPAHVQVIFGATGGEPIPIENVIRKLKESYHVFVLWPDGGYNHAREQYVRLFGEESVVTLQHPNLICEMIGSLVGLTEKKHPKGAIVEDLLEAGVAPHVAKELLLAAGAGAAE